MPAMDYSKIADLYDLYAQTEVDIPFFIQELEFYLHSSEAFELLASSQGFRVELLDGDY